MTTDLINGVPADQWGTWCQHGERIVEPVPDTETYPHLTGYPEGRIVDPWPCDVPGCTQEKFEREMADEEAAFESERWAEYRALTR